MSLITLHSYSYGLIFVLTVTLSAVHVFLGRVLPEAGAFCATCLEQRAQR
jgi:hypothetical protein